MSCGQFQVDAPIGEGRNIGLAIASVSAVDLERDSISYLIAAKESGIVTALSPSYEAEILPRTGCETLEKAPGKHQCELP